jgi:hypothetical protein
VRGGLTRNPEQESIITNRPGRYTYPQEKSVLTSGATPGKELHATVQAQNWERRPISGALRRYKS